MRVGGREGLGVGGEERGREGTEVDAWPSGGMEASGRLQKGKSSTFNHQHLAETDYFSN